MRWSSLIGIMPTSFLRQAILSLASLCTCPEAMQDTLPQALLRENSRLWSLKGGYMELSAKQAIDWIGLQMNELSGEDLASRCRA